MENIRSEQRTATLMSKVMGMKVDLESLPEDQRAAAAIAWDQVLGYEYRGGHQGYTVNLIAPYPEFGYTAVILTVKNQSGESRLYHREIGTEKQQAWIEARQSQERGANE